MKVLSLFSGGLDSLLAVKILEAQGLEVTGICFVSSFYNAEKARLIAENNNLKLIVTDVKDKMLDLVKNPPTGYGKNLNPCIDCHSMMIREASIIAEQEGFDIVATGEVLGQRPFSQNGDALQKVKKLSGVDVLRPLSAKLLPETEIEKQGLVKRDELLDIEGRSRERQQDLIKKFKIEVFETPSGGCVLTDKGFCNRLSQILDHWPECTPEDVDLLRNGRVFWFALGDKYALFVVGRHKADNEKLKALAQKGDFVLELKEIPGPLAILRFKNAKFNSRAEEIKVSVPENIDFPLEEKTYLSLEELLIQVGALTGYFVTRARGASCVIKTDYK